MPMQLLYFPIRLHITPTKLNSGKNTGTTSCKGFSAKKWSSTGCSTMILRMFQCCTLSTGNSQTNPLLYPKKKVDDIPIWHCCQLEISWDTEDVFTAGQFTRLEKAIASVRDLFVDKNNDIAVIEGDSLFICSQVIIPKESVPRFCSFLTVLYKIAREHGKTIYDSMQFVPWYFQEFAVMSIDFDKGIALPTYYRY